MPYVPAVHAVPAYIVDNCHFFQKLVPRHHDDEIIWYWGGFLTRHVTIASRPLEKTALRRGPALYQCAKGAPPTGGRKITSQRPVGL